MLVSFIVANKFFFFFFFSQPADYIQSEGKTPMAKGKTPMQGKTHHAGDTTIHPRLSLTDAEFCEKRNTFQKWTNDVSLQTTRDSCIAPHFLRIICQYHRNTYIRCCQKLQK